MEQDNSSDYWTSNIFMKKYDETLPKPFRIKYNVKKKDIYENKQQFELINNIFEETIPKKISINFNKKQYDVIYGDNIYVIFYNMSYIIICINRNIAFINNIIGKDEYCFEKSLFDMSINFLTENKDEFGIDKIILHDKVYKKYNDISLKFCDIYMFNTW